MNRLLLGLACGALLAGCGGGAGTPTGPSASGAGAGTPRLSLTRFLAFGDSLTLGEVTAPLNGTGPETPIGQLPLVSGRMIIVPSAAYPGLLQAQLASRYVAQSGSIIVINEGKSGEHAHEGVPRFAEAYLAARPEVVLLWEGANSLHLYGTDLPTDALTVMTVDARTRGSRVFIANLPPTRLGFRNSQPLVELLSINTKIAAMATAQGAVLVNIYDAMLPEADTLIGSDGLHPTEAGYRRIADIFFSAIRAELEVR